MTEEQLRQVVAETVKSEIAAGLIVTAQTKPVQEVNADELITRKEAAKILGVSLPTLNAWTKDGTVQGYRLNSRVRYKRGELSTALVEICKKKRA